MEFNLHAWIEDNKVKCASQYCIECSKFKEGKCKPAKLIINQLSGGVIIPKPKKR